MVYGLLRGPQLRIAEVVPTHIVVAVVVGEVAAGDLDLDAVAAEETTGGRAQLDSVFDDFAGPEEVLGLESVAVAGADHADSAVDRGAVWVHVHQSGEEVRVSR